jgi:hypothetical protein
MSSGPEGVVQPSDDMNEAIGPDVDIPGPYPSGRGDTGESFSSEPEPTKETRGAASLGNLTEEVSTSAVREETGGLGSPLHDEEESKGQ